jgi:predicted transcriptional regulator
MISKQNLRIKNKTKEFFFKSLIKETQFLIISYKNSNTDNDSKTITKNQVCNSLSHIINKNSEKFPLQLKTFKNLDAISKHFSTNKNLITCIIKVKNIIIKNASAFNTIKLHSVINLISFKIILIKKLSSLKISSEYLIK